MSALAPGPVSTPLHVVGAAIVSGRRCLVTQRSETMPLPLKWEFPGGKVEPGEPPTAALVREIAEELSLEVRVGAYLGRGIVGPVTLDVYRATLAGGELSLREHRAARWVGVDELGALDWAEADRPVLPRLRQVLVEVSSGRVG